MAPGIAQHDFRAPAAAIRDAHRARKLKLTLMILAIVLLILTFGGAAAMMYSDAPQMMRSRIERMRPSVAP